jgi:hypothetical protein
LQYLVTIKLTTANAVKSAATNTDRFFRLNGITVGRQVLEVSYTGYKTVVLSEVLVATGIETEVKIELVTQNKQLNEVKVSSTADKGSLNSMAMSSNRSFRPEKLIVMQADFSIRRVWRKVLQG